MSTTSTPTEAVRVWAGFRSKQMTPSDFLKALGDTFIPGTLAMLQPLGICAYNVAALIHEDDHLPHECALIVYRTPSAYRAITRENLLGRVHRASHYAVFDMERSRASFPVRWQGSIGVSDAFYLFDRDVDWQRGTLVFAALSTDSVSSEPLQEELPRVIQALTPFLAQQGYQQALLLTRERFVTLWAHSTIELPGIDAFVHGMEQVLKGSSLRINKVLPVPTYPSYDDRPELMRIDNDTAIQFRFRPSENTYLY